MPKSNKALVTFSAGEWSPSKDARIDLEKAPAAARTLRNMIIDRYGGVFRRPGFKYISTVKTFAAFTNVSYLGSGTLYGITEFGDLSDPPKKYRNLISNDSALARWTPGGSYNGLRLGLNGRVNYNDAGTKTAQVANNQLLGNAGIDWTLYGSPPVGTPDWIGLFASSTSGGGVRDTLEGYDPGGSVPPSLTGQLEGTWVRNKQKKGWDFSTLPAVTGDDANSPAWLWQSYAIGSTTTGAGRANLNVYAVAGASVWTVYVFYQMEHPSTGTGPSSALYVKLAEGDQTVDASSGGQFITGNNGASGSPSYIYARFSVPMDTSMRFYLTITGETPGQFPKDWSASAFPITDAEIVAAGGRNWFYLPEATVGIEGDDEYAELLTVEDAPIDFLTSSGASGVTVGTEEWAYTSSYAGGITAESHSPITYTQRVVKSTYNLTGLTTGYTYPVTLVYQQKDYPTGLNITAPSEIVNVVATGASMAVEATIIAPVDKQRKLVSATAGTGVAPVTVSTLESETVMWKARVLANGGTFSSAEAGYCDDLVAGIKGSGVTMSNIRYLIPFIGSDINTMFVPLLDVFEKGVPTNNGFVAGDYSLASGVTGDGSSYLLLPFTPNEINQPANTLGGWGAYVTGMSNSLTIAGYQTSTGGDTRFTLGVGGAGNWYCSFGLQANNAQATPGSNDGFFLFQRGSATSRKLYRNGTLLDTDTTSDSATDANAKDIPVFCLNNSAGTNAQFCDGAMGVFLVTNGTISDTNVGNLNTALSTWLTALGR